MSVRPQDAGVTLVYVVGDKRLEPSTVDVRFTIERGGRAVVEYPSSAEATGAVIQADRVSVPALSALARALCPIRVSQESAAESLAQDVDLFALLGVPDVADIDPQSQWRARTARQFLRVPLGMAASGLPLTLDLKESALGGMGPHGLVVGATGSGKSELLRTLVLALATTHDPERLAFVLVDYKGGATFAGMEPLPHVAGAITNLQEDLGLVDRMHDALYGEIRRRQRVLKEAGNLPNVHEYNRRRDQGEQLDPLPSLLLIVDEFSELLTAKPDFAELFCRYRADRPIDRCSPPVGVATAGDRPHPRTGEPPELSHRTQDLQSRGEPRGDRCAGRVRVTSVPWLRVLAGRHDGVRALQGGPGVDPV